MKDLIVMKEDGHVDMDALLSGLQAISSMQSCSRQMMESLLLQLGLPEDEVSAKEEDAGQIRDPFDIIRQCEVAGNQVRLPAIRLNKKVYAQVKKLLEDAGAAWSGNKTQAFVFPFTPIRVMEELRSGKRVDLQQDYQFFETPDGVADWLVELADGIRSSDRVLEPSAGRGALVRAIHRSNPDVTVDCYELMPENREILSLMRGIRLLDDDFMTAAVLVYDKIIANPPFSNSQDMDHVRRMHGCLSPGGVLVAITGVHWTLAENRRTVDFRTWLHETEAQIYDIPKGAFKKSGTGIATKVIAIKGNDRILPSPEQTLSGAFKPDAG
jgi:hypothetical protein